MRGGQRCDMFAELACPQEEQAALMHAERARLGDALLVDPVIGVTVSV